MKSGDQQGFMERWLRRCGERPGRTLVFAWLALLLTWLALGAIGWRSSSFFDAPPSGPSAVPYRHIQMTAASMGITLNYPPEVLAAYKATAGPQEFIGYGCDPNRPKDQPLAHVMRLLREVEYGWPWRLMNSRRMSAWDVTDPGAPYQPAQQFWKPYLNVGIESISWGSPGSNDGQNTGGQVFVAPIAAMVLLTQFAAALLVLPA